MSANDGTEEKSQEIPDPAIAHQALLQHARTLVLATLTDEGEPFASYTPFLYLGPEQAPASFYVFVSTLAAHTRHMMANGKASVLIVADEQDSPQIFARIRVQYRCDVREIESEHSTYQPVLEAFQQRHGKMVNLLRQLSDFKLLELHATKGNFIQGFGQAFNLAGENLDQYLHTRTG